MTEPPLPNCAGLPIEDLVAWLDAEASPEEAARASAHVATCDACRREAEALRRTGRLLEEVAVHTPAPSIEFAARVAAAVPRGRLHRMVPRIAVAAAVLVGAAAGAWWLAQDREGDVLTAREEEAIARDLDVLSNLDALERSDPLELAQVVDDLDVIDAVGHDEEGG
jgi:anti-sigma factor RsiW